MASKLQNLSGAATVPPRAFKPRCKTCGDFGYVGCPEARLDGDEQGDLIVIAFRKGTKCTCEQGVFFAEMQAKFNSFEGQNSEKNMRKT